MFTCIYRPVEFVEKILYCQRSFNRSHNTLQNSIGVLAISLSTGLGCFAIVQYNQIIIPHRIDNSWSVGAYNKLHFRKDTF